MKGFVLILFILICSSTVQASAPVEDSLNTKADSLVNFAKTLVGTTYKWGGTLPSGGFDCSGFCYYVFRKFKVKVPRSSSSYGTKGVEVDIKNAKKGDVILFTGTDATKRTIGHVGIVISEINKPLQFIHSSSSKKHYGVTVTRYDGSNYPKRFMKIVRVIK